jgi:hypothetical protein
MENKKGIKGHVEHGKNVVEAQDESSDLNGVEYAPIKKEQKKHSSQPLLHKADIMRSFRKHWRKHGAKYCLWIMIAGIWSAKIVGGTMLLMLTVPCGIQIINTDKRLWYLRQLFFAGIGLLNLFT